MDNKLFLAFVLGSIAQVCAGHAQALAATAGGRRPDAPALLAFANEEAGNGAFSGHAAQKFGYSAKVQQRYLPGTAKGGPGPDDRRAAAALAGQVVNEAGAPLAGVIIVVQGLPNVSSTNAEGRFLVPLSAAGPVLVFSCAGYRVQTVVDPPADGPLAVTMYALSGNGTDAATIKAGGAVSAGGNARAAALAYAEVMPAFTGGDAALHQYLIQKINYPAEARRRNLSGTVYVSFVVDEQGRICDAEVAKGCGNGFDAEALRLVRLMPWWTPGRQGGQPVRVARTLPIVFSIRH